MVFEPTFEELDRRSAELAGGGDPDVLSPPTDADVDGADDGGSEDLADTGVDGALSEGDVRANDLPPDGA